MSQRMTEQARAEEQRQYIAGRPGPSGSSAASGQGAEGVQDEGYWAYMQRQLNERTEKLGIVGDSMEQLQEQSAGWSKDVSKYVNNQKRKMVLGSKYLPPLPESSTARAWPCNWTHPKRFLGMVADFPGK